MSRATECLMDAGCLPEFLSTQPIVAGTQQKSRGFSQTINLWYERSRQRRELLELASEIELLDDIGLSYYDVRREGRKPFWRE